MGRSAPPSTISKSTLRPDCNSMARPKSHEAPTPSLLIITGSMGAGKTSILAEASDILASRHIVHAAIDLDAFGLAYLSPATSEDSVMYTNLKFICRNFASLGVRRFLVARALENCAELELCRGAARAARAVVCRLTASVRTMQRRVRIRESGLSRQIYIARVAELNALLDAASLEDFSVANEHRSLTDVANEMLLSARWISR